MSQIENRPQRIPSNAIAYTRVSTTAAAEHDVSLAVQLGAITRYGIGRGLRIVGKYEERGVSGTSASRPVYQRLIDDITRPGSTVGTVIVAEPSRLTRSAKVAKAEKEKLRRIGVRFVSVRPDPTDARSGEGVKLVLEALEQFDNEARVRRTRRPKARSNGRSARRPRVRSR